MNALPRFTALFFALLILPGAAQRPQGLGRGTLAAVSTPEGIVAITTEAKVLLSTNQWLDTTEIFDLQAVQTVDDRLYALAARGSRVVAGGTDGLLYTANLAVNPNAWTAATGTVGMGDIRSLAARPDADTWMAATDGALRRSNGNNAGAWTEVFDGGFDVNFSDVTWSQGDVWVAVGNDGFVGVVYRSINNGVNWSPVTLPANVPHLLSVAADGFGNVLAVGENGGIYRSADNGATFSVLQSEGENYHAVVATGENTWAIGGLQRTLHYLDDQGVLTEESVIGSEPGSDDEVMGLVQVDGSLLMAGVDTVPPPAIDAENDPVNPVIVTLIPDDEEDALFYSVDGSAPETAYTGPFVVTGTVTVQAVALRNGVYSPVVSREIEAGQFQIFEFTSISVSGGQVILEQDTSNLGVSYRLEYTLNLAANPVVWSPEGVATQSGTGNPLTWTVTPVPNGTRIWRAVLTE